MLNTRNDSQVGCTYECTDKLELDDEGGIGRDVTIAIANRASCRRKKNGRESEGIGLDIWTSEDERDEEGS